MTGEERKKEEQQPEEPQPAEPQEPAPPEEAYEEDDEGVDPRILVFVGIIVLLIVIIYWRRATAPADDVDAPPGVPHQETREREPDRPPTYQDIVMQRLAETSQFIYRRNGEVLLVARPPMPARFDEEGQMLAPQPGSFFDVTHRREGLSPLQLYRRQVGDQPAFADVLPPLGLGDEWPVPVFEPAADVTEEVVSDQEPVYGVALDGEAKAYPMRYFHIHDVVNDTLGGRPVVLVYSALGRAINAFERPERDGDPLEFGCSGLLFRGANVAYDAETRSLWNGMTGEALAGEMLGERLARVPVVTLRYHAWKKLHPDTLVMTGTEPDTQFNYARDFAAGVDGYHDSPMLLYPLDGFEEDLGLHPKATVFGVLVNDTPRAYDPRYVFEQSRVEDTVDGVNIVVSFEEEKGFPEARTEDGQPLHCQRAYWFAWKANYPESGLVPEPEERPEAVPEDAVPPMPEAMPEPLPEMEEEPALPPQMLE